MPIYKWNEVRESKGAPEELAKQKDFPSAPGAGASAGYSGGARQIPLVDKEAADNMKRQAREDADHIRDEARSDIEAMREKAFTEGLETGKQEIQKQFKENLEKSFDAIQEALDQRKNIIHTAEPEILKLGIKIAQQIIHSEITLNRGVIMNIVTDAINKITDREQVIIKVNNADLEQVKDYKDDIEDLLDGAKNLSIVPDKKIEAGGCVIETKIGLVDAKVSTKLEVIEKAFMKVYTEDVKKEAKGKGKKIDSQQMYRMTGEVPEEKVEAEEAAGEELEEKGEEIGTEGTTEAETAEDKEKEEDEGFDEEDLDLDLDFDENDMEQTG